MRATGQRVAVVIAAETREAAIEIAGQRGVEIDPDGLVSEQEPSQRPPAAEKLSEPNPNIDENVHGLLDALNNEFEPASPYSQPTKACPYCGEQILAVAIKCKHCGSDLTGAKAAIPPGTPNDDSDDGIYALAAPIETPRQPFNFSGVNSPRFASSRSSSRDNRSGKNYRALRAVAWFYRVYGFLSLFFAAIGVLLLAGLIAAMMGGKAQLGPSCQIAVISVVAGIVQGIFALAIGEAIILAIDLESNTCTTNVLLRKLIESAR